MLRNANRIRVTLDTGPELITKQSFKDECDINHILSQFKRTGIINHINQNQPIYAELPDNMDYQQSLHIMEMAENAFATLPSVVRRYFDNDPAQLLLAIGDPDQKQKLIELGVLNGPDNPQPAGNPATLPTHINPGATPTLPTPSNPSGTPEKPPGV